MILPGVLLVFFTVSLLAYLVMAAAGVVNLPKRAASGAGRTGAGKHLFGSFFIGYYYWLLAPLVRACHRIGVTPNQITLVSLALSTVGGVAIAAGWFGLAAVLVIVGGSLDMVDGQLAR